MTQTISASGLALVRKFEGFNAEPKQLTKSRWVVGYGHIRAREPGAPVTKAEAAELLAKDLARYIRVVNGALAAPVRQSQFDALVSFAFSVGEKAFLQSPAIAAVNAGSWLAAAAAMAPCDALNGEFGEALELRRAAERALFLKDAPNAAAPSALVRARAARRAAPRRVAHPAQRLTQILQSEPQTAALLLTQVVEHDAVEEITTAHAAPVARRLAMRRFAWPRFNVVAAGENFGLMALLLFGGALVAMGLSMFAGGGGADYVAGSALAGPGLAASLMSGYGLWRAPKPARA